jgi:hypothetical protein
MAAAARPGQTGEGQFFFGAVDVICSTIAPGTNPPPPPSPLAVEVNQLEGCC